MKMNSTGLLSFSGEFPSLLCIINRLVFDLHSEASKSVNTWLTFLFSFSNTRGKITEHTDFIPKFVVFNQVAAI